MSNTPMYIDIETNDNTQQIDVFLNESTTLDVELSEIIKLDIDFGVSTQTLSLVLNENNATLDVELQGGGESKYPYYGGPYEVNPRKVEQVLATKHTSMSEDVIIHPIFYSEVSNPQGGLTVNIGLE